MLISVICISGSFFIIYKLYAELLQIQNQMILLNARMSTLSDTCAERLVSENGMRPVTDAYHTSADTTLPLDDGRDIDVDDDDGGNDLVEERTSVIQDNTAHVQDGNYAFLLANSSQTNLYRLRRANRRKKEKKTHTRRKVKSSGIF